MIKSRIELLNAISMLPGIFISIYFWNKLESNAMQASYIIMCIGSIHYHFIKSTQGYNEYAHSIDLLCQQLWICSASLVNPYQGIIFVPWYGWFFAVVNQYARPLDNNIINKSLAHVANAIAVIAAIYPNGHMPTWVQLYGGAFASFVASYIKLGLIDLEFLHALFHIILHIGYAYYCVLLLAQNQI